MADRHGTRLGPAITVEQLEADPHAVFAALRRDEPVAWLPALDGWLVTRYELAVAVMRDPVRFTVEDPRFSTAQVIGPSMLSLDGEEHGRHREPFVAPFRAGEVRERFAAPVASEAGRLLDGLAAATGGELRRGFAGPLAAAIVARALGLGTGEVSDVLGWYDAIVAAVTEITAGRGDGAEGRRAFAQLGTRLRSVIADPAETSLLAAAAHDSGLRHEQIVSDAAVLLFGGIETTEGMIANALLHLLEDPERLLRVRRVPELLGVAIEESLRLEPAAAVVDRYATCDLDLGGAHVARGDLVRVSIAAPNRDPAVFPDPDRFDLDRGGRRHVAFAHGPHVCVGVHLARLEARTGIAVLLERLPDVRLDPKRPAAIRGLVFRKPPALHAVWG